MDYRAVTVSPFTLEWSGEREVFEVRCAHCPDWKPSLIFHDYAAERLRVQHIVDCPNAEPDEKAQVRDFLHQERVLREEILAERME